MNFRHQKVDPTRRRRIIEQTQKLPDFAYSSTKSKSIKKTKSPAFTFNFLLQRVGLFIFLAALFISVINVSSLSSTPHVITLKNSGNQSLLQPEVVYQNAASSILKSSLLNRSKLTVNTSSLSQALLKKFPELSSASVTIPLLSHRPIIYIQPAQPALALATNTGTFVIDTDGKALQKLNTKNMSQAVLPTVTDQSGLVARINKQILPAASVKFIEIVIAELSAKQYKVSSMSLPPLSDELDTTLAGQPYLIKYNLQSNDPAGETGTFLATVAGLKKQNITPAHYVDVRVEGRAYYQ